MPERSFDAVARLKGVLIVSCQADAGEPLCQPQHILALSLSALNGGAKALRLEGIENVRTVSPKVDVPILGITKIHGISYEQRLACAYITPTFEDAKALSEAGADIIAMDATGRPRKDGLSLEETVRRIHLELGKAVMADIATLDQAIAASEAGFDLVSTTLYGYTKETVLPPESPPSFELLENIIKSSVNVPVIMEGRVWHPEELTRAFELGAHAVVVGSAITRPQLVTQRFVAAIPKQATQQQDKLGSQKTK